MRNILIAFFLLFTMSAAFGQRIKPAKQIEKAVGANYCLVTDLNGEFQIIPCASSGGDDSDTRLKNGRAFGANWVFDVVDKTGNVIGMESFPLANLFTEINFNDFDIANHGDINHLIDWTTLKTEVNELVDVTTWDNTQITNLYNQFSAINGLTKTGGVTKLGGPIIENTLIEDATNSFDMLFKKGTTHFGFQESDVEGLKSWNVTDESGGSIVFAKLGNGQFKIKAEDENSTILEVSPLHFGLYRDHQTTGDQFSMTQFASGFAVNLSNGANSSAIGFTGAGNINLTAKSGANESNITINGGIEIRTGTILDGTAENGMFLKLVNQQFGDVEYSNELPALFIQTNPLDFDGNGTSYTNLEGQLQDIYDAIQTMGGGTDNDNQTLFKNGANIGITGGNEISLIDFDTDQQNLSISASDVLTIERGNSVDLAYLNRPYQTLAFDNATRTLSIANGNAVVIPADGSGGGGGTVTEYHYEIGSIDDGAFITASDQNITYSRTQNAATITVPAGVTLDYLEVFGNVANFTQEDFVVNIVRQGTNYDDTYTRMRLPTMHFVKTFSRRTPNSSQYWLYDTDAPPTTQKQITGLGGGQVQATFKNAKSSGTTTFVCVFGSL